MSEVEKGIVKRVERFGYIEMADDVTLKEAVNLDDYQPDEDLHEVTIMLQKRFDLRSGREIDPLA